VDYLPARQLQRPRGVHLLSSARTPGLRKSTRDRAALPERKPFQRDCLFRGTPNHQLVRRLTEPEVGKAMRSDHCHGAQLPTSLPWQIACERKAPRCGGHQRPRRVVADRVRKNCSAQRQSWLRFRSREALGRSIQFARSRVSLTRRKSLFLVDGSARCAAHEVMFQSDGILPLISSHRSTVQPALGVLLRKTKLLEAMPPYQGGGGDMIASVPAMKTSTTRSFTNFELALRTLPACSAWLRDRILERLGLEKSGQQRIDLLLRTEKSAPFTALR